MRLIDADALIEQWEAEIEQMEEPLAQMFTGAAIRDVRHAPTVQPELDIRTDGTLHISISKGQLDNIGRVIVIEDGTAFCKLFY